MAVGGDIKEVTYNHPTLGSGVLYPKAGEDSTYDLGGYRSDDEASGVDGGGNMITQMSAVRWSFDIVISWDMNNNKELEEVVKLAGDTEGADWTFTHINGTIYAGKGRPVGDLKGAGMGSTFSLKVAGGGILKSI